MTLTDSQFKGNWGEQFIASELAAKGCLIRHVTQGHDTGVDLYCETTFNGIPFLHFWCQVKTRTRSTWKEPITYKLPRKDFKHISYWLNQPVPVVIILVPSFLRNEPTSSKPYCLLSPLDIRNGEMKSFCKVRNYNDLNRFLIHELQILTERWDLREGRLNAIKRPGTSDQLIGFEPGVTLPFKKELLRSMRWGSGE